MKRQIPMWHRISVIALNTYREAVRARILHGLFGLAIATGAYSLVVGAYALQEQLRVVSDLGAASASLYAVMVAVILGATSLYRELELKTIFPILARPLHRAEYLVGKYFGTLLTLAVFVAAYTGLLLLALGTIAGRGLGSTLIAPVSLLLVSVALGWRVPRLRTWLPIPVAALLLVWGALQSGDAPDDRRVLLGAGLLTFLEVCIVCALATVFASFSSPFLTALFTLGFVLMGRSADTLARLPERVFGAAIKRIASVLSEILPNLMAYVPPRTLLTGEATGVSYWPYTGAAAVQAVAWSVGLLALSAVIFRRRDFL
jgi:ABC-type transport system involved in multi-copper enzyme maturation permease subunit